MFEIFQEDDRIDRFEFLLKALVMNHKSLYTRTINCKLLAQLRDFPEINFSTY